MCDEYSSEYRASIALARGDAFVLPPAAGGRAGYENSAPAAPRPAGARPAGAVFEQTNTAAREKNRTDAPGRRPGARHGGQPARLNPARHSGKRNHNLGRR
jgi:hypothetical protein